MKKTEIIIFSKNRAFQLRSLLLSLRNNSDIEDHKIDVLYKEEPEFSYDSVIAAFGCNFVKETNFFYDIIRLIEESNSEFVLFMVDDLIVRDFLNLREIEGFLERNADIDAFSLRLGEHIRGGKAPEFHARDSDDFLVYDTSKELGNIWNYFWEVSASIYRRDLVLSYMEKSHRNNIGFPNPFEEYYYDCMPHYRGNLVKNYIKFLINGFRGLGKSPEYTLPKYVKSVTTYLPSRRKRLACYRKSRCFTQGINMVATRGIEYKDLYKPEDLQRMLEEDVAIDYRPLRDLEVTHPNAGNRHVRFTEICDLGTSRPESTDPTGRPKPPEDQGDRMH